MFFFQKKSLFNISSKLDIALPIIRRWISKCHDKADAFNEKIENILINAKPGFRPASTPDHNIFDTIKSIFKKVFILVSNKNILLDYGITSWLNLTFQT